MILETVKRDIKHQFGIKLRKIVSSLQLDEKDHSLVTPFEKAEQFLVIAQRVSNQDLE
jgi:hypothetical protein